LLSRLIALELNALLSFQAKPEWPAVAQARPSETLLELLPHSGTAESRAHWNPQPCQKD